MSDVAFRLAVALGIGLLLGAERERRKGERGSQAAAAGLRTFALVALLGGLTQTFSGWAVFAISAAFVAGAALLAYRRTAAEDPGLTTEVAMLVTFLLGALALREPVLAAGLGTAVTVLLASRSRLHHWVRERLSEREFDDALLFLGAALVVLPLAPNRDFGPVGLPLFNPFTVWRLVVLVMFLQAIAYVALRVAGPRRGLLLAGFLGGFVSSTLTIAALARSARDKADAAPDSVSTHPARAAARKRGQNFSAAVAGATLSTVTTVLFLAFVIATTSLDLLRALAPPLAAAGLTSIAYAGWFARRRAPGDGALRPASASANPVLPPLDRRAFDLRVALALAAMVSGILTVARLLHAGFGDAGLEVAVGLAGFADVQSAAISAATVVAAGQTPVAHGVLAVLFAFTSNTISKFVAAWAAGERRYAAIVSAGLALVLVAAWLGALWSWR